MFVRSFSDVISQFDNEITLEMIKLLLRTTVARSKCFSSKAVWIWRSYDKRKKSNFTTNQNVFRLSRDKIFSVFKHFYLFWSSAKAKSQEASKSILNFTELEASKNWLNLQSLDVISSHWQCKIWITFKIKMLVGFVILLMLTSQSSVMSAKFNLIKGDHHLQHWNSKAAGKMCTQKCESKVAWLSA